MKRKEDQVYVQLNELLEEELVVITGGNTTEGNYSTALDKMIDLIKGLFS